MSDQNKFNVKSVLQDIASAIKYKLEDDTPIAPVDFASKIAEIPVEHGGYGDPTPIIEGTVKLVSNSASFIREYAFYDCDNLTAVTFPNCIEIRSGVFSDCANLKMTQFDTCETIGDYAFANCPLLSTVNFPACTTIGASAFYNCDSLSNISFPECTTISANAFANCSILSIVSFPLCQKVIGGAFTSCPNLELVSLPVCEEIGMYAFSSCKKLSNISLPAVTEIGWAAFSNCTNLSSISFPEVLSINSEVFPGCAKLSGAITLPKLKTISSATFAGTRLTTFNFPELITFRGDYQRTTRSPFPGSTIEINAPKFRNFGGQNCFANLPSLTTLNIDYSNITDTGTNTFYGTKFSEFSFPALTTVGSGAFMQCSQLTRIYTGRLNAIYSAAFKLASALTTISDVTLPKSNWIAASIVSASAFNDCRQLSQLTFISGQVSFASGSGWIFSNCYNLENITFFGKLSSSGVTSSIFSNTPIVNSSYLGHYGSIYVPQCYLDYYTSIFSKISSRIAILDTSDIILPNEFLSSDISAIPESKLGAFIVGSSAFKDCYSLEAASLLNCMSVSAEAFRNCQNLSFLSLPNCKDIAASAFYNCTALSSLSLPECSEINYYAFTNCSSLNSLSLPKCEHIGTYAFMNCSELLEINLPNCTSVDYSAFINCQNISSISLPQCTYVGRDAFANCINLSSVSLPEADWVSGFANCTNLESVFAPKCRYIGDGAFYNTKISSLYFPTASCLYQNAFGSCNLITLLDFDINFPGSSSMTIYSGAFRSCYNLSQVLFGNKSFVSLGSWIFANCSALQMVDFGAVSISSNMLSDYMFASCSNLTKVILPSNLKTISNYVFNSCTLLSTFSNIPSTLTTINGTALNGCAFPSVTENECTFLKLTSDIYYLANPTVSTNSSYLVSASALLNPNAFSRCTNMEKLIFTNNHVVLPEYFSARNATALYFTGNNIIFENRACDNATMLSSLYLFGESIPEIVLYAFGDTPIIGASTSSSKAPGTVYVRESLIANYISYFATCRTWTTYGQGKTTYYGFKYTNIVGLTDSEIDAIKEDLGI